MLLSFLELLLIAGGYAVYYFTRKKMGMARYVIYINKKLRASFDIEGFKLLLLIFLLLLSLLALALLLRSKNKGRIFASLHGGIHLLFVLYYLFFCFANSVEKLRPYYFMYALYSAALLAMSVNTFLICSLRGGEIAMKKGTYRLLLFIGIVIVISLLNARFGWSKHFSDIRNLDFLKERVRENLFYAALLYIVITVAASVLLAVPGISFAIVAGVLFGPWMGTLLCAAAATLGALLSFIAGRFFLKDSIKPIAQKNSYLKKWLFSETQNNDLFILMITRLIPIFPYNLQNFAYGTTDMKMSKYALGTFVFIIPGTAMYTIGAAGFADRGRRAAYIGIALLIALVLTLIVYFLKKKYLGKGEEIGAESSERG